MAICFEHIKNENYKISIGTRTFLLVIISYEFAITVMLLLNYIYEPYRQQYENR